MYTLRPTADIESFHLSFFCEFYISGTSKNDEIHNIEIRKSHFNSTHNLKCLYFFSTWKIFVYGCPIAQVTTVLRSFTCPFLSLWFSLKNMFMSKLNFSIEKSKYKLKNLLQYLIEIFLTALNFTDRRRRSNVLKVYKKCRIPIQNFLNRNYLKSLVIYDAIF